MKKLLVILTMIASVPLISCSKDDDSTQDSLAGTTWVCSEPNYKETLIFKSGGQVSSSWQNYYDSGHGDGSYTYQPPAINIHIADDGDSFFYSGTVNGNVMTLTSYGQQYIFKKQ